MELPDILQKIITSACESGRQLSWKVSDNANGTLVQLVWKTNPSDTRNSSVSMKGCSKWKTSHSGHGFKPPATTVGGKQKQRNPPSRQRRNARRLAAFLEKKHYQKEQDHSSNSASDGLCIQPTTVHASTTSDHSNNSLVVMFSNKPDNQVVTDQCNVDAYSSLQADLKDATNVLSEVCDGSPGISYLPRSGPRLWTPVVAHEFGKDVDLKQCFINEKDKVEFVSIRNEPALRLNFSPSSFLLSPIAKRTRSRTTT